MIPKIIHYCWFGGAPKPESVLRCIDSWRKKCPDFEIREWTEKDIDVNQNAYTKEAYEAKAWGFVPDYLRLWIVYHYGGVYLDTDVQVVKDLTPLLNNRAFVGIERDSRNHVALGLGFGAEPGNDFIFKHMKMYEDLHFILSDGSYNRTPSPQYTTQLLRQLGYDQERGGRQELADLMIYSEDYFCPKSYATGTTRKSRNTYSIHHYDASWYTEDERIQWKKSQTIARLRYPFDKINLIRYNLMIKVLGFERYEKLKMVLKGKHQDVKD